MCTDGCVLQSLGLVIQNSKPHDLHLRTGSSTLKSMAPSPNPYLNVCRHQVVPTVPSHSKHRVSSMVSPPGPYTEMALCRVDSFSTYRRNPRRNASGATNRVWYFRQSSLWRR